MQSGLSRVLGRFRQPEYTGENRCIPCTGVNVAIAAVLSVVVGIVAPPAGVAVFVLSVLAIYLRGYLVPGTPTFTKRYFPDWLLAKFDKAPAGYGVEPGVDGDGLEATAESESSEQGADDDSILSVGDRMTPEQALREANIVEPCADTDDLCLVEDARTEWHERMAEIEDGSRRHQVARMLGADSETLAVTTGEPTDHVVVRIEGRLAARWESEAALIADLAGSAMLASRLEVWDDLSVDKQSQFAGGLRAFLETCPTCGGAISIDAETVESCCRSYEVYAITCDDCGARLLEVDA